MITREMERPIVEWRKQAQERDVQHDSVYNKSPDRQNEARHLEVNT